ncbi:FMN-binding protein [Phycicoccus endophyticus]|uniref:FMN-binding protein n=1 Tax=Phycicoccus endophyticus TaxID=1690220 RepID=A0A7G9QY46_9MICO|nr:FMN-binding protein [Phycicoccus endophyticus]NHI19154.1 FMN-binding protein [Phycicoccus endophyticus]QNN48271.1 FMN-binding protein [Phycicoccus endophyticus]GGL40576.1 hypothetical protein GCM10012283_23890 [Phycicoccus endophyticus]
MRRITTWLLSTVSALVLLFSYHTSTGSGGGTAVAADANGAAGSTSGDSSATGSDATGSDATGSDATGSSTTGSDGSGAASDGTGTGDTSGDTGTGSAASGASGGLADGTYTGEAVQTRYGPVQVKITVSGGKITSSVVTQVPWSDHRDQEINAAAVPILNAEAVQAQSADIDMVSGATFTSQGYLGSLQSAIDEASR